MTKTDVRIDSHTALNLRLGAIDLLPREADKIIEVAKEDLRARRKTQTDVYREFVSGLEGLQLEIKPPSFSAFNRWAGAVLGAVPQPSSVPPHIKIASALRLIAEAVEELGHSTGGLNG